mgnify:CR=1 FL=1
MIPRTIPLRRGRAAFSLIEVLLVVGLVAVVLTVMAGLVFQIRRGIESADRLAATAHAGRRAMDRLSADIRCALYHGPAARYAFGLNGRSGDHPDGGGFEADRLTLILPGVPRGAPADDETVQTGRCDLRLVVWEVQTVDGKSRLVRLEQAVLDAVGTGEVVAETVCDDIGRFHLQYWGVVPQAGVGEEDPQAGAAANGFPVDPAAERTWSRDWKTGLQNNGGLAVGADPLADPTAFLQAVSAMPEHQMPAAVHIVLVLRDPRPDAPPADPDAAAEEISDRWFETVVCPATHGEVPGGGNALANLLPPGTLDALNAAGAASGTGGLPGGGALPGNGAIPGAGTGGGR